MVRYHSIVGPMVSYHWKPLKNHRVQWLSDQKPSKTNGWSSYWKKHHYYSIACPMVSYFWKPIEYNCTETKTNDHSTLLKNWPSLGSIFGACMLLSSILGEYKTACFGNQASLASLVLIQGWDTIIVYPGISPGSDLYCRCSTALYLQYCMYTSMFV